MKTKNKYSMLAKCWTLGVVLLGIILISSRLISQTEKRDSSEILFFVIEKDSLIVIDDKKYNTQISPDARVLILSKKVKYIFCELYFEPSIVIEWPMPTNGIKILKIMDIICEYEKRSLLHLEDNKCKRPAFLKFWFRPQKGNLLKYKIPLLTPWEGTECLCID